MMNQRLFSFAAGEIEAHVTDLNLKRGNPGTNPDLCRAKTNGVEKAILEFQQGVGHRTWRADELVEFVQQRVTSAATTPNRVLRKMRREGALSYTNVDRSKSLYRFDSESNG